MCSISCQCGHTADYFDFTKNSLGFDLPRGDFQCPLCKTAWTIKSAPGQWVCGGELYIPGDRTIEILPPEL